MFTEIFQFVDLGASVTMMGMSVKVRFDALKRET
jgi:hypothetical protein